MNIKITCCKKSVVVKSQARSDLKKAAKMLGFSEINNYPNNHLQFYEPAATPGCQNRYIAIVETTNEPLTQPKRRQK